MMPYLFSIGPFQLRVYSLMYLVGIIITIIMMKRKARAVGLAPEQMENAVIFGFLGGVIAARMYYVILRWDYYHGNIFEMLAIWHGGLAIHGGIIGGVLAVLFYARRIGLHPYIIGDMCAPWLLLAQGIGRFGNFANGEAHGVPTITPPSIIFRLKNVFPDFWNSVLSQMGVHNNPESLSKLKEFIAARGHVNVSFDGKDYVLKEYVPWGISFTAKYWPPAYQDFGTLAVHPTFFYEMILNFIGAAVMYILWKKNENIGSGRIFGMYLIFYGVIRGFVTTFRADDLMLGFIRAPHLASLILIIAGAVIMTKFARKQNGQTESI